MNKKRGLSFLIWVFFICAFPVASFSYDETDESGKSLKAEEGGELIGIREKLSSGTDFGVFTGTLVDLDNTNPDNVKLQVKDSKDDSLRTVLVSPWTKVTKATSSEDLRVGDTVRVMIRKTEDKEVAMSVIFGNIDSSSPGS